MDTIKEFFDALWKLIVEFVAPLGGLAFVIAGISSFFANKIAERKLEELKIKHSKEIELYRTQLEIARTSFARYSEQQFTSYNQLWSSLFDLKTRGDQLWKLANDQNFHPFIKQLKETQEMIERNSLFIEDDHYEQLQQLLKMLSEYELGKKRLIELRRQDNIDPAEIHLWINHNGYFLEQYTPLIAAIRKNFKQQINVKLDA